MSKQSIKATINANIKQNGVQAITGQIMNSVLNGMVDNLAAEDEVVKQTSQTLTPAVQTQVRQNIGAIGSAELEEVSDKVTELEEAVDGLFSGTFESKVIIPATQGKSINLSSFASAKPLDKAIKAGTTIKIAYSDASADILKDGVSYSMPVFYEDETKATFNLAKGVVKELTLEKNAVKIGFYSAAANIVGTGNIEIVVSYETEGKVDAAINGKLSFELDEVQVVKTSGTISTGITLRKGISYDIYVKALEEMTTSSSSAGIFVSFFKVGAITKIATITNTQFNVGTTVSYIAEDDCNLLLNPPQSNIPVSVKVSGVINAISLVNWLDETKQVNPKYYGKTGLFIGDSISTQNNWHWKGYLKDGYGINYVTYSATDEICTPAVGGITFRPHNDDEGRPWSASPDAQYSGAKSIWYRCGGARLGIWDFDFINLFGGGNDLHDESMVVGTINDTPLLDTDVADISTYDFGSVTWASAYMGCIEMLRRDFPDKEIVLCTTLYSGRPKSEDLSLLIIQVAQKYGLKCVPWYWSEIDASTYQVMCKDGVHPREVAANVMASRYASILNL